MEPSTDVDYGRFTEAIKLSGYPVENFSSESIDWLFQQNQTMKTFLTWFSNCIEKNNFTSEQEIQRYSDLKATGQVLEGKELEDACIPCTHKSQMADEMESVKELTVSLQKIKVKKNRLKQRCNRISVQHIELKNKIDKMEEMEDLSQRQNQHAENKCRSVNTQMEETLSKLCQSVSDLMMLYKTRPANSKQISKKATGQDVHFLSQIELESFHEAEAKFSKELTTFTKKQFFAGMAEMAGEREETEYNLLDLSSVENLSLSENKEDSSADCQEFMRLQNIFPQSASARISALINAKKATSAVQEATSILHQLKSRHFPLTPKEILSYQHDAEQNTMAAKGAWSPLLSSIQDLIKELGNLQGTEILTGDYDLKLRRQEYFVKCQEKVIEHLVSQRSRSELVSMLFDLELQWHKETHALLSSARQVIGTHLLNFQARMSELEEPGLSEKRFERNVVDSSDSSTARLFQLMGNSEQEKQLYLPVEKVAHVAAELKSEHKSAKAIMKERHKDDWEKIKQLELCVNEEENLMYSGSSTCSGLPNLTPVPIQSALTQLFTQLSQLQSLMMEVITKIDSKKQEMRNNKLQKKERELFVLFHTNPERLDFIVNGLADKAKAMEMQNS